MKDKNTFNLFGATDALLKGGAEKLSPKELDKQFETIFGKPESTETVPILGYYIVAFEEGKPLLFLGTNTSGATAPLFEGAKYIWTAARMFAICEDDLNVAWARYFDQFDQKTTLPEGYTEATDIGVRPILLSPKLKIQQKAV